MIGKPIMIKNPQKDLLTTNLKSIKNYKQRKSMSTFWILKLCVNQHFTLGWTGLEKKT